MIGVVLYDNFASFEVILAIYLLKTKYKIVTIGNRKITSYEGLQFTTNYNLNEIMDLNLEALIIPGGDIDNLEDKMLIDKISSMASDNKLVAAICSGISILQKANLLEKIKYSFNGDISLLSNNELKNLMKDDITLDGNILTAKPQSYIDFAIEAGKYLDIYQNKEDLEETINFFKFGIVT